MRNLIKNLETLSKLKGYNKTIAAMDLEAINKNIQQVEQKISSENNSLNRFYEEIRQAREEKALLSSDSYSREFNHINIIKEQIEQYEKERLELLEQKRLKKQQVVSEMNKEKLYTNVAADKKQQLETNIKTTQDNQLQEQWLANNYNND